MFQSLSVIAPVIAVIAVGYLAGRRGFLSADNVATLNAFVFAMAAPALLFRNVALTEFPASIPWGLWLSYYGGLLAVMAAAMGCAVVLRPGQRAAERVITGFGAAFSNTVMLGIPIILTAFGAAAGLPLFLILAFHGLLVFSVAIVLLEKSTDPDIRLRDLPRQLARSMRDQQVMLALAAGVAWNFSGLGLAAPVDRFLELLGSAAIPVALIAVGGRLAHIAWRSNLGAAVYISAFKLIVMPALVYGLAQHVFALPPLFVATTTVLAAMPTGVFTAVFAARYQAAEAEASSTIVVSTVLGAATIAVWLSLFGDLLAG